MKANPNENGGKEKNTRPVRAARIQASTNWLPVPVAWPKPGSGPQPIRIRQTPPWTRPGLNLL